MSRSRDARDLWCTVFVVTFGCLIIGVAMLIATPFLVLAWLAGGCP